MAWFPITILHIYIDNEKIGTGSIDDAVVYNKQMKFNFNIRLLQWDEAAELMN